MIQHTPGPWEITEDRIVGDDILWTIEHSGYGIIGYADGTPEDDPEKIANARLIAAAPDLLEAADNILNDSLAAEPIQEHPEGGWFVPFALMDQIEAAITKAQKEK